MPQFLAKVVAFSGYDPMISIELDRMISIELDTDDFNRT